MAPDGKMFDSGSRKGELFELKVQLNANTHKERKQALKRVVAAMSLGRDMSSLFPDVVKNTTGDLSMKKLVYLYIINYAQSNSDLSILIVNTFIKDSVHPNPLIRALAIRTMALIHIDKITEYLCEPLHSALKDQDPYVRKTAAVCVAKLYDTNPSLAIEEGFISSLQNLIMDPNPMTVANAVAALSEIAQASETPSLIPLNSKTVPRFLSALSECTEWGQVFILDAIAAYTPSDSTEADNMVERIIPRLQHVNPSVVLAAIRVITGLMPRLDADEKRSFLIKKMSAPLITLLKAEPELQFVVLRNIALLLRSFPSLLSSDVRVLFVSYNDPPYVKREKLDALVHIADESNCNNLLTELLEYVAEVDIWFAQLAVHSIGRIALRLPDRAPQCVGILSDILLRKIPHLTEQIAVAAKDISRAYPKQFTALISQLCESVEDIDDPKAKACIVWVIGEHADELDSSVEMLEIISTNIAEENPFVQLQILTATMKAYLLRGNEAQNVVNHAIKFATEQTINIDLSDRGRIYSRLISTGVDSLRNLILSQKPPVTEAMTEIPAKLHQELLSCLSSVAAVYHKPPKLFEGSKQKAPIGLPTEDGVGEEDLLGLDEEDDADDLPPGNDHPAGAEGTVPNAPPKEVGTSLLDDLLGAPPALPAPPTANAPSGAPESLI